MPLLIVGIDVAGCGSTTVVGSRVRDFCDASAENIIHVRPLPLAQSVARCAQIEILPDGCVIESGSAARRCLDVPIDVASGIARGHNCRRLARSIHVEGHARIDKQVEIILVRRANDFLRDDTACDLEYLGGL